MGQWVLYGANGFTGELTARLATEQGLTPILSGRNAEQVNQVAKRYGFESAPCSLDDPSAIDRVLSNADVVLHCAGPFSHTYRAMSDACLRTKTHYTDITGEIAVFEGLARRDKEAKSAGVMLMPGVGFDVVPSDCLANHLKRRMPDAKQLTLAFQGLGRLSRGTATTMAEGMGRPGAIRKDGVIVPVPPGYKTREIDFGRGPMMAATIPWGDVSTAYYSSGIPNIEVFTAMPPKSIANLKRSRYLGWLLQMPMVQNYIKGTIRKKKPGPDDAERAKGASLLWGEVGDGKGRTMTSRLQGPEGYTLTALTSLLIIKRILSGESPAGFQTPAKVYGPDLIMEIEGVTREDLD